MRSIATMSLVLVLSFSCVVSSLHAAGRKAYTDPKAADADFAVQGEYVGEKQGESGKERWGVQVIALGKGTFRAVGYRGGLPGDGWNEKEKKQADGKTEGSKTVFKTPDHRLEIQNGSITVLSLDGNKVGQLKKVMRKSPTLGAKPPKGAVVLFDGSTAEHFQGGKMTEDGLLMQGVTSKQTFGSHTIHIEFILPYMPEARGQGRGNSGFYAQGRYETQMLDSFGLEGKDNECGGIYKVAAPRVNMCYPPLSWQTYDIDFTAAKYKDGKRLKNARITVRHNGVTIHDDQELPSGQTTGGKLKAGDSPGPVYLQNHGNPVRYRNIWVVEKK